ncbi:hypothetical protein VP01_2362g1 [Puccinia sorghi]|uniref:Uncharacterized protein n=1 Tax=Puccinia sorghi TaxID=27349 RepID=A0A0L6V771_9BASI|nr:hypothetical protein VP01_2362g1 [Puccinia sorghi]
MKLITRRHLRGISGEAANTATYCYTMEHKTYDNIHCCEWRQSWTLERQRRREHTPMTVYTVVSGDSLGDCRDNDDASTHLDNRKEETEMKLRRNTTGNNEFKPNRTPMRNHPVGRVQPKSCLPHDVYSPNCLQEQTPNRCRSLEIKPPCDIEYVIQIFGILLLEILRAFASTVYSLCPGSLSPPRRHDLTLKSGMNLLLPSFPLIVLLFSYHFYLISGSCERRRLFTTTPFSCTRFFSPYSPCGFSCHLISCGLHSIVTQIMIYLFSWTLCSTFLISPPIDDHHALGPVRYLSPAPHLLTFNGSFDPCCYSPSNLIVARQLSDQVKVPSLESDNPHILYWQDDHESTICLPIRLLITPELHPLQPPLRLSDGAVRSAPTLVTMTGPQRGTGGLGLGL